MSFPDGEHIARCSFETVPAGKALVVEFISGNFSTPEGQPLIVTTLYNNSTQHSLFVRHQTTAERTEFYVVTQPIRIYVDEGDSVGIRAVRVEDTGVASGTF